MKYKVIACDVDETFLNDKSNVPKRNVDIVKKLMEEYKIKFVLASGRGYHTLQKEIKILGLDNLDDEYIVGMNGACISRSKSGEVLYFNGLDFNVIKKVFDFGKDKNVCIHITTIDKLYTYNVGEGEKQFMLDKDLDWISIDENIDFLKNEKIAKIMFQSEDMEYLKSIRKKLENTINENISYSYSSNRYIEMNALNVNKGSGIKVLCEILNIAIEEVIGIGDNINDLDMFEVTGLSIAVSNALEEVKEKVDYVARTDNNYGVLEEVFEKFIKNK